MKNALVELRWDGAPPLPRLLRVIARAVMALDRGYILGTTGEPFAASDLTDRGARLTWHKHGGRIADLLSVVGYHHPCAVRWQEYGVNDDEPGRVAAEQAIGGTPWILSRTQGHPDVAGRIGRHPGGGKAYGRREKTS